MSGSKDGLVLDTGRTRIDFSERVAVMGILNATPDSFFDRGRYFGTERGTERARELLAAGADILDIGGVKAAAGRPLPPGEELRRVMPLLERVRDLTDAPISVDTFEPEVAREALAAGADIINDISGLRDPRLIEAVAAADAHVVVMHIAGPPRVWRDFRGYKDVTREVVEFLEDRVERAVAGGVARERILIDPGLDFDKDTPYSLELLRNLPELSRLGLPVLVAPSRKDFVGETLGGLPPEERLAGTAAAVAFSACRGANVVRVHDVEFMSRVVRMTEAMLGMGRWSPESVWDWWEPMRKSILRGPPPDA
ncbi:DHPS: dihydropteroate synthase [Rubrobacter radiotolerans]|uniref:Dihydropteroate synthase n=1 Tax=Rubrobacter radiotolerans TaxID=42256 RepID=A0A023X070_RUBRA|nr:dihydropteroate synthase [Rubrobacter radiotolerans]AHY45561.1 DHPS: dihydropteroate synthase [Rubrobacter radiotolerans]MDX5892975.1 dihydropteroate synthase [Rubrobacter radiotolerans]SMC02840.1 dihydropteroate synthase [Rubrobacter radiotolerans DSM 5868]